MGGILEQPEPVKPARSTSPGISSKGSRIARVAGPPRLRTSVDPIARELCKVSQKGCHNVFFVGNSTTGFARCAYGNVREYFLLCKCPAQRPRWPQKASISTRGHVLAQFERTRSSSRGAALHRRPRGARRQPNNKIKRAFERRPSHDGAPVPRLQSLQTSGFHLPRQRKKERTCK